MKTSVRLALVVGLVASIVLIARGGAVTIISLFAHAGWILLLLVPLQAIPLLLDVLGWHALILERSRIPELFLIATIRQAINRLLPVANVGGDIVGIRLLAQRGLNGTTAAASVIVEALVTLVAQYFFVALGMCLVARTADTHVVHALLLGLALGFPPLLLLVILLRNGQIFRRVERLAQRLVRRLHDSPAPVRGALLDASIRATFAARGRVLRALSWQFAGLIAGCSETWLALRWLGHPVGVAGALVLESLTQAVRSVFFMVPAGLGVQEAGLIVAGHVFGVATDVALALSLTKRMRELLFGLPALAAWQWIEGRRILKRWSRAVDLGLDTRECRAHGGHGPRSREGHQE